jgi:hypothetical protein
MKRHGIVSPRGACRGNRHQVFALYVAGLEIPAGGVD